MKIFQKCLNFKQRKKYLKLTFWALKICFLECSLVYLKIHYVKTDTYKRLKYVISCTYLRIIMDKGQILFNR